MSRLKFNIQAHYDGKHFKQYAWFISSLLFMFLTSELSYFNDFIFHKRMNIYKIYYYIKYQIHRLPNWIFLILTFINDLKLFFYKFINLLVILICYYNTDNVFIDSMWGWIIPTFFYSLIIDATFAR